MTNLLRKLPNLRYLTAETDDLHWDGHSWQQMIADHLPKLKRFRLCTMLRFADDEDKETTSGSFARIISDTLLARTPMVYSV